MAGTETKPENLAREVAAINPFVEKEKKVSDKHEKLIPFTTQEHCFCPTK